MPLTSNRDRKESLAMYDAVVTDLRAKGGRGIESIVLPQSIRQNSSKSVIIVP